MQVEHEQVSRVASNQLIDKIDKDNIVCDAFCAQGLVAIDGSELSQ